MMAESESVLLERFAGGDAEAFAQIVGRYAGLVYGTCLRVLADADRAADATQETFFHLTKNARRIRGSLGAWLHRVAVRQAVDRIRSDSARRKRERAYAAQVDEAQTWHEVSPCVDEALEQLDERTRTLLVRHYLEGRSMAVLADESGVSRPTVSRQIDSGLARVRAHLKRQGVLVTAAGLSTLLAENVAQSAPEIVLRQLGKMTLLAAQAAGTAGSGASSAAILTGGVLAAANTKLITAAVAVIVVAISVVAYKGFSSRPTTSASPALAAREDRSSDGKATPTGSQGPVAAVESQSPELPPSPKAAAPESKPATPFFPVREVAESEVAAPGESAASGADSGPDLSSPEATVRSFTKAFISGNAEAVMACMLPGGTDHEDVQELLAAGPDDPQLRDKYQFRLLLQSLDPDAEMPIHSTEQTERGTSVSWQVIFKKDLAMAGHMFHAGDTFELDATLRKSGDSWLIDGI
jgi:RNA polymerase sigma-70 factor (ECF subfamily)